MLNSVQPSLYIDASIGGRSMNFLLDSGSSVTIITEKVYQGLVGAPVLRSCNLRLTTASGNNLKVLGKTDLVFKIGQHRFEQETVVAGIDGHEGIIGIDFLTGHNGELNFGTRTLKLRGHTVKISSRVHTQCARIRCRETVTIPQNSGMHFPGYVCGNMDEGIGMVEPDKFISNKNLLLAKTVIAPKKDGSVTLSILNLTPQPIKILQNTFIGSVEKIETVIGLEGEKAKVDIEIPPHLQEVLDRVSDRLTQEERGEVETLLKNYQDVFAGPGDKLGQTKVAEHYIDTGDSRPIKLPPRRLSPAQKEVVEAEVEKMLENDIIEPSTSPWAAPVVLVKKKDGTVRFCIDYRRLNTVTRKDAYPLPLIEDALDTLYGAKWFSTLDLASGYWQCSMNEADKPKTAFATHQGLYQFRVMPFGLCNAPATFSRMMQLVLGGFQWTKCLCYLDDVIVFGTTFQTALANLQEIFECLRQANLTLKTKKCTLFQTEVEYLGHIVSEAGISCNPEKLKAVAEWPQPINVSEVRSFLGLAGYYRRFIPHFSSIVSPLTALTSKTKKFQWDSQCQEAFENLKGLLTSAPILAYPNNQGDFILDTDASNTGLGAVLSQVQGGEEVVIAYASKMLNRSQRNYCTTYKELLSVVTFMRQFKHFLLGKRFLVRTDHASLIWLKKFKDPEGMLARWISVIDMYDCEIKHRQGSLHQNADSLSRKPLRPCKRGECPDCSDGDHRDGEVVPGVSELLEGGSPPVGVKVVGQGDTPVVNSNWVESWGTHQIREWQDQDEYIHQVKNLKAHLSQAPSRKGMSAFPYEVRVYCQLWDRLVMRDGVLCIKDSNETQQETYRIVAPENIRREILLQLHDSKTSGHLGRDRTTELVRKRFYWPGLSEDVRRWCRSCTQCAKRKPGPGLGRSPLRPTIAQVSQPLDRVAVDILGGLQETENGNVCIIVVSDYFTKWAEAYAVKDHTALTVADKLCTEFFSRFGIPKQLHSDRGREFESELFGLVCEKLGIEKTRTTPYRPQSDGLVERLNRTLIQMLAMYVNDNLNDWDDHLPYILTAYRSTPHVSTGCSPNLLMLGREINLPLDVMVEGPVGGAEVCCHNLYVDWLQQTMREAFGLARENLGVAAARQKNYFDRGLKARRYEIGEYVWRWYPPALGNKLGMGWSGPYKVVRKLSEVTYEIQKTPQHRPVTVHVDHIKPYWGEAVPFSWSEADGSAGPSGGDRVSPDEGGEDDVDQGIGREERDEAGEEEILHTPVRTRAGRVVRPKVIFTPQ